MRIARGVSPVRLKLGSRVLDTGCGPAQPAHVSLARAGGATSPGRSRSPVFARTHNRNHAQAGVSLLESDTLRWTETGLWLHPDRL